MELKNKLFAILAIFCVIFSACAVSASDMVTDDSGVYLDDSHDGHDGAIIPPDNTHDEARHAAGEDPYLDASEDGHNGTIIPPDVSHDEAAMMNATGNSTHAAGENVAAANGNATGNSTGNSTAAHLMHATGNPIVALLAICTVLGGAAIIRRK